MYFHTPTLLAALRATFGQRPFSARHAFFAVLFVSLFLLLRSFVWLARLADQALYPGYAHQPVRSPLFIIGNPRSGTTFTHRLLAGDGRFTSFALWQTIFPAVCLHKLFGALARLDAAVGSPLARLLNLISDRGFSGWSAVHRTGPGKAESDEMLFVYGFVSPLVTLLFPFFGDLPHALYPDRLPPAQRERLKAYFVDCLRRHIYATGPDKLLLEKVALIAGRLELVLEALPDARIVHLVRHPYQSVPSLISMLRAPWPALAPPHGNNPATDKALAQMIYEYYRLILKAKRGLPPERFLALTYDEVVADPRGAVERIYAKFGLEMTPEYRAYLEDQVRQARSYASRHGYSLERFGLTREEVYRELREVFEEYGFEP